MALSWLPTRRTLGIGLAVTLAVAGAVTTAAIASDPARAATLSQVYPVPAGGTYAVTGHGWGHGHGMSQWGAQGAAEKGLSAKQILDLAYPGTGTATVAPRTVRVLLTAAGGGLQVWPAAGLGVTDGSGAGHALPGGQQRFRAVRAGAAFAVQSYDGHTWTTVSGLASLPGPVSFGDSAAVVRVGTGSGSTDYRGTVAAVANGSGLAVVDSVALDSYVQGVVPRESPSSWLPAALQAQAVAARTYALYEVQHAPAGSWDICDTSACQVYGGVHTYGATGSGYDLEAASSNAAVAVTANQVRTWQGQAAFTQFSSSDGGYTSDGGFPYLNAHPDPYDGVDPLNTGHTWTASLPAAAIQQAFPAVGQLVSVEVTGREGTGDWGGRVTHVLLHGTKSTVSTTGYGLMYVRTWPDFADGLRSQWWTLGTPTTAPAAQPAGLVPLSPTVVTLPARGKLAAGGARTVSLSGVLPRGATAAVVAAQVGGVAKGTATTLSAWPAGQAARSLPLAAVVTGKTTFGTTLVRLGGGARITLGLGRGSATVKITVLAAVAPGGLMPATAGTPGQLLFNPHVRRAAPTRLTLGSVPLTVPATGAGLRLAIPVGNHAAVGRGRWTTVKLGLKPPAGAHGVLVTVTAVGPRGATVRVVPQGGTKPVSLSLGPTGTTSTLAMIPSLTGRIGVTSTGSTAVTLTVAAWL